MTKPILPPEPVALDSLVSICIGTDQYAAKVDLSRRRLQRGSLVSIALASTVTT